MENTYVHITNCVRVAVFEPGTVAWHSVSLQISRAFSQLPTTRPSPYQWANPSPLISNPSLNTNDSWLFPWRWAMPSSAKESHHLRKWATSSPPMSHTISANEPHYLRQWVPLFHYRLSHLSSGGGCLWRILNSVSEPTIVSLFFNICFQFSHSIGWIGLDLIKFKRMLFLHFSAIFYNHKSVVHMYSTLL